jgi:hypothetical protein
LFRLFLKRRTTHFVALQDDPYETGGKITEMGCNAYTDRLYDRVKSQDGPAMHEAIETLRLGLCGRIDNGQGVQPRYEQLRINPVLDRRDAPPRSQQFVLQAAIDSFLLISRFIDVAGDLKVNVLPNFGLALITTADAWYTHDNGAVCVTKIPSFRLGCFGTHGEIWVAFPKALDVRNDDGLPGSQVPKDLRAYIRRSLLCALTPTHAADVLGVRDLLRRGRSFEDVHHLHVTLSNKQLDEFCGKLRAECHGTGIPALQRLLILSSIPNFGRQLLYPIGDSVAQHRAFATLARRFRPGRLHAVGRTPYVGICAMIRSPDITLHVDARKHIDLIRWIVPTISQRQAQAIVNHPMFWPDDPGHVHALSGFQWTPLADQDGPTYSDICHRLSIQHHNFHVVPQLGMKSVALSSMLPHRIGALQDRLSVLSDAVSEILVTGEVGEGRIFIDVLLPLRVAQASMSSLSQEDLPTWVVPYEPHLWW